MNFKTRHQITIGLTGGILCGKSTALAAWQKAGAFVLSCDELVREISARLTVQKKIRAALGVCSRADLTQKVFKSATARKQLEQILHPLVLKEAAKRLKQDATRVRVVEVPLLFEAGWEKAFDLTVALTAPAQLLAARAAERGLAKTDFLNRQKAQWPQAEKAARADICLVNSGSVKELTDKVYMLQRALCRLTLPTN